MKVSDQLITRQSSCVVVWLVVCFGWLVGWLLVGWLVDWLVG